METLQERAAGLDIHRSSIVACVLVSSGPTGPMKRAMQTFETTAAGPVLLLAWLRTYGVTHVGMEGTGVYWLPVYMALEEAGWAIPVLGNARHIKNVPGRKTDIKDAQWIATLIRYGLIRRSFIPPRPIRALRDLTRYRRTLVEAQASERRRLIKLLEATNMKLAQVLSDVFGVTGRAIVRALIKGDRTPEQMAELARGVARKKRGPLAEALGGRLEPHQRLMLAMQLDRIEGTEKPIETLDTEIDAHLRPYRQQMQQLMSIPGIDRVGAAAILAEIGPDLSAFPTAGHLAAWAGACPGNYESAGKKKGGGAREGNTALKTALCNAAIAASRTKGSYFRAKYYSLKPRIGGGKAALAIGHRILVCIWHMFTTGSFYQEPGEAKLHQGNQERTVKRYAKKLEKLGYAIVPTAPATVPQASKAA
jgi:transposase